jgi:hypothetical protein
MITDATGGALPGATVTITQPTTGSVRTVVTNELGLYRVLNLNPAEYDVTVELNEFAKVACGSVKIDVGQADLEAAPRPYPVHAASPTRIRFRRFCYAL